MSDRNASNLDSTKCPIINLKRTFTGFQLLIKEDNFFGGKQYSLCLVSGRWKSMMAWRIDKRWNWFQTAHVNSASSGAIGSCWAFCTPVWDETYRFMITEADLVVQSFLPTPDHTVLNFFLCQGSGPLCKLWGCLWSLSWPRGFTSQYSFHYMDCPTSIPSNCQSTSSQAATDQ